MPAPPLLSLELLDEFERQLRLHQAPALDHAQPGLTSEQMHALVEPLGLRLPVEAVVWWGWRNGTGPQPRFLLPYRAWLSLEEAVWRAADFREQFDGELLPDDSGPVWPDWWLPITTASGPVALDKPPPRCGSGSSCRLRCAG